ncbi:hypothetical protein [Streptomyces sp. Ag109_G2-6]|uniref:hypothetical protein n=1 Tax=Streptomyces sp. Ag109_G2-6 TaxID=2485154 RepID=UPI000F504BC9|nr:hypothetical protein [Streptomyces sp. Ag109_G2-6]
MAGKLAVHDVYRQHKENGFTQPCEIDQREIIRFQATAMEAISENVQMVELSPVAALGSNSALAGISQKTVLGTIRNTEVVADGVTVLALEAAKQRDAQGNSWPGVTLGTFHRELRTQAFSKPGFKSHFHALSLISAENASDFDEFKIKRFAEHIVTYLRVFEQAEKLGYFTEDITVAVSNLRIIELLIKVTGLDRATLMRNTRTLGFSAFDAMGIALPKRVQLSEVDALIESLPEDASHLKRPLAYSAQVFRKAFAEIEKKQRLQSVDVVFDMERHSGMGYYQDICAKISARNAQGDVYPLVDIGTNDWLAKITNRRSDRLITGGMGVEIFISNFRNPAFPATT